MCIVSKSAPKLIKKAEMNDQYTSAYLTIACFINSVLQFIKQYKTVPHNQQTQSLMYYNMNFTKTIRLDSLSFYTESSSTWN